MTEAYDDTNVFARILRGEIPAHKVYEDDHTLAIMDIMPAADGHVLVIPKTPCRNILDCPDEVLQSIILVTAKLARATQKAFIADGITVAQYSEKAGGQEVFHLHFHVIPRQMGEHLRPLPRPFADHALLARHGAMIRQAME